MPYTGYNPSTLSCILYPTLVAAACNLGVEVPLDCPFRFLQKEIIYDFPVKIRARFVQCPQVFGESLYLLTTD